MNNKDIQPLLVKYIINVLKYKNIINIRSNESHEYFLVTISDGVTIMIERQDLLLYKLKLIRDEVKSKKIS